MRSFSTENINLLRHNARAVVRELGLLNDAYFDIGVTLAERHLLIELNSSSYPTVGEIAEKLLLDKSTASRLISKAVKKGYIQYAWHKSDKRKRFLQFTDFGKKILNSFEPIAFDQTKQALLTLSEEEVGIVCRGMELYAQGLKNSRLRNTISIEAMIPQDSVTLAHLTKNLNHTYSSEFSDLYQSYQKKGSTYFVMKIGNRVVGGAGLSPRSNSDTKDCQCKQFIIESSMANRGCEKKLIDFCVNEAKKLGYARCFVNLEEETQFPHQIFYDLGFKCEKKEHQKKLLWKNC